MKKISKMLMAIVPASLFVSQMAFAALSYVGPNAPANGFPRWYKDANGNRLALCLDTNTFCLPPDVDLTQPISFPENFPTESFWFSADAALPVGNGEVRLVMAIEAAFAGGVPLAGDRVAFNRLRIRARGIPLGTYRITHPYGQQIFEATSAVGRQINSTNDVGVEVEKFTGALLGEVGPFLKWDPAVAPLAPAGFIGDPNVLHPVVGSPFNTNFLRVERRINNAWVIQGETNQFSVAGKFDTLPEEPILSATPAGGVFTVAPIVTINSSIPANIFYTLDNSNPLTSATRIPYVDPIQLPPCAALKFAAATADAQSDVSTQIYVKAP